MKRPMEEALLEIRQDMESPLWVEMYLLEFIEYVRMTMINQKFSAGAHNDFIQECLDRFISDQKDDGFFEMVMSNVDRKKRARYG
jgi:hypothetical protein